MTESEVGAPTKGGANLGLLLAVAFFAGAGTMLLEVLAPRVMQPYFGASTFVWTNVIGVILLVMALGYNLGGRLSERDSGLLRIAWTLGGASLLIVLIKPLFPFVAEFLLPSAESLANSNDARARLEWGSLVAAVFLFCPPVLLLATITPQLVHQVHLTGLAVGRASGRVFMWGTLGSLFGTFLPTYWLVPSFGTSASLCVATTFLLIPSVLLFVRNKKKTVASSLMMLAAFLILGGSASRSTIRPALDGEEVLVEEESRYQYLRLVKRQAVEDETVMETKLCLDEGLLDFHSVDCEGKIGTLGKYYDYFALLPTAFPKDKKLKILVLGSGMGTMSSMFCSFWPDRVERIVDVEIDPRVVAMAKRLGHKKDPRVESVAMDARAFARLTNETFDLILVDAYARQVDIPFHMTTVEFFRSLTNILADDGVVALNVSVKEVDAELTRALFLSMHSGGLSGLHSVWVRYWGNRMLWGSNSSVASVLASEPVHPELAGVLSHALRNQSPALVDESAVRLTDDHAPIEILTRKTLTRGD